MILDASQIASDHGPAFIGIGAQRAGTTWLHAMLSRHPQVWLPPIKELHHFDMTANASPGVGRTRREHLSTRVRAWRRQPWSSDQRDILSLARYDVGALMGMASDRRYCALFARARAEGLVPGEITPAYAALTLPDVERVRAIIGTNTKVLFILRDPIDRMWSHATMQFRRIRGRSVTDVPEAEVLQFLSSTPCTSRTDYAQTLAIWQAVFSADSVRAFFFDAVRDAPAELVADVQGFLGLSSQHEHEIPMAGTNSYRRPGDNPSPAAGRQLADFALAQIAALRPMIGDSPYLDLWQARAEALLTDTAQKRTGTDA